MSSRFNHRYYLFEISFGTNFSRRNIPNLIHEYDLCNMFSKTIIEN